MGREAEIAIVGIFQDGGRCHASLSPHKRRLGDGGDTVLSDYG